MKWGILNLLESSGLVQVCSVIALLFLKNDSIERLREKSPNSDILRETVNMSSPGG
jgi:hypothetical protein